VIALLLAVGLAAGHPGEVFPERWDAPASWVLDGEHRLAAPEAPAGGGTRVASFIELVAEDGTDPVIFARGEDGDTVGAWHPLEITWRGDGERIGVLDLGRSWPSARLRVARADASAVDQIAWELLTPRYPDAGRISREAPVLAPMALDPFLDHIGVFSRAEWGARATTCTSTEDDWYRMAIHHTAGNQTGSGTVAGAVAATQAYAMDSGTYCDIPYQFMVGYDGTLYEARSLDLFSGATGNNNDGNIAISFLGCYHPDGCPTAGGDAATDEMLNAARLLAQTLVELHAIPSDRDSIRGHQEWPDNATACPGDYVLARIDEITWDLPWYGAEVVSSNVPIDGVGALELGVGESATVELELRNTAGLWWEPGVTNLGTTGPRDMESPLADGSWSSTTRAASVPDWVAPGGTTTVSFTVTGVAPGEVVQSLGMVHEWWTWFADGPWGAGPADDAITLRVVVSDAPTDTQDTGGGGDTGAVDTASDDTGGGPGPGPSTPPGGSSGGEHPEVSSLVGSRAPMPGCGCSTGTAAGGWVLLLAAVGLRRRR
jgi:N-acetylmuramoyl-L-alanine amidase